MPTYAFQCAGCGAMQEAFMTMSEYIRQPPAFFCCGERMGRHLQVVPGLAVFNALSSERHYDGMRATDGTDISTRAKHREYMKAHSLTTADDFASTWKRAAQERAARLQGEDPQRRHDIAQAIARLGG